MFYIPQRYWFSSKSQRSLGLSADKQVVLYTTKVLIFKQITTVNRFTYESFKLFYIPQRYWFSSKSQLRQAARTSFVSCFIYHKGTDFQANHNSTAEDSSRERVVLYTTKVLIFKQITTDVKKYREEVELFYIPQRYWFSSKSQQLLNFLGYGVVVLYTTKVLIFKQITTLCCRLHSYKLLFYIPQRYWFSSKSQHLDPVNTKTSRCFIYHKGTDFQANHNTYVAWVPFSKVVLYTKRILASCFIYHKGTDFQANHNWLR